MNLPAKHQFRSGYVISLDALQRYLEVGHGMSFNAGGGDCEGHSEEETKLCEEESKAFHQVLYYGQAFQRVRRRCPQQDIRLQLVAPCTFTRVVQHKEFGERNNWRLFIPTGSGGPALRNGPSELDIKRIHLFIDTANSLIKDDARREKGGFRLSEPDFKFEAIPEQALEPPAFSERELKDFVEPRNFEAMRLYGITPRQFIYQYRAQLLYED